MTLWDTGNLERYGLGNVTRSYFRRVVGVVLVYDVSNRDTLDALYDWVGRVKDDTNLQWENSLNFVVWGNNRDQTMTSVSEDQMKGFLCHLGLSEEDCYEVDAYSGWNVFESYQSFLERIHVQLSTPQQHNNISTPPPFKASEEASSNFTSCSC